MRRLASFLLSLTFATPVAADYSTPLQVWRQPLGQVKENLCLNVEAEFRTLREALASRQQSGAFAASIRASRFPGDILFLFARPAIPYVNDLQEYNPLGAILALAHPFETLPSALSETERADLQLLAHRLRNQCFGVIPYTLSIR